jgi:glycolate oxidase iron-sulfur subunit
MQTSFSEERLRDPDIAESNRILRTCVHCGFCTATCPTFVLLGDELDSPRGRIYLIKDMLENDRPATPEVVKHVDRCLSCLSCMTTCPSGVHYMHLVDHARRHIEETYERPKAERALRRMLSFLLPYPWRFRLALLGSGLARPMARLVPGSGQTAERLRAMLKLAPTSVPSPSPVEKPGVHRAEGERRGRVALLTGCAQQVLAPSINEATIRLLTRMGIEVVVTKTQGCCGALDHHMGHHDPAMRLARANIEAWHAELEGEGLDAVVINASGCGTTVKDYGFMFRTEEPAIAAKADAVAKLAMDVSEVLVKFGYQPAREKPEARGLRGEGTGGGASLLRLGRHLQPAAAGDQREAAGAEASQSRPHAGRPDRLGQYRLHHAAGRGCDADGPHGRAARLDGRRAGAGAGRRRAACAGGIARRRDELTPPPKALAPRAGDAQG